MGYYSDKLGGNNLQECYEIAPSRVKQYLDAEICFVMDHLNQHSSVLELGCGYGRVTCELAKAAGRVVGIDTSCESVALARKLADFSSKCEFHVMDALDLRFPDDEFDVVVCAQNGICAFNVDRIELVREALRVTRPGGRVLFSSYAECFWPHRLEWFLLQANQGFVGEIDLSSTGNGVIVCTDGFRAGAMSPADFKELCKQFNIDPVITEVDGSSLFCELNAP